MQYKIFYGAVSTSATNRRMPIRTTYSREKANCYPLLLALANLVKSNHYNLLIWHIFYIQQEENGSICVGQRITLFHCCANKVLLFCFTNNYLPVNWLWGKEVKGNKNGKTLKDKNKNGEKRNDLITQC